MPKPKYTNDAQALLVELAKVVFIANGGRVNTPDNERPNLNSLLLAIRRFAPEFGVLFQPPPPPVAAKRRAWWSIN